MVLHNWYLVPGTVAWVVHIRSQFKNSDESLREAEAKFKQGKFAEAEPLFLLGLVLLERTLPEDHPEVLSCMEKLGDTFYASEKFKDAQPVYRRLVGIREKSTGPPQLTVSALFKLAKTHERLSQPDEAEEHYRRATKLGESTTGPLYANLCDAFAGFLKRTNRDQQEAIRLAEAAKKRRASDTASLGVAAEAAGSTTLQVAAVRLEDGGNGGLLSPQARGTEPASEAAGNQPAPSAEKQDTAAQSAPAYSSDDLNSIKVPSPAGLSAAASESAHEIPASDEQSNQDQDAIEPAAQSSESQPVYTPGQLDDEAESSSAGSSPADGEQLDSVEAPGEIAPSLSDQLEPESSPSEPQKSAAPFSLADLDAIKTPGATSALNKAKLDAFRASDEGTAGAAKSDAGKPAPKAAAVPLTPDVLDSIGTAKASADIRITPPDSFIKPEKSVLDLIKPPASAEAKSADPQPIEPATDPRVEQRKALSATRGGAAQAPPADLSALKNYTLPGLVLLVLIVFVGVMYYISMNNNNPANGPTNASLTGYIGKSYISPDHKQHLAVATANKGQLTIQGQGKKPQVVAVAFREYGGNPLEEMQTLFGSYDQSVWLQDQTKGLTAEDGGVLYVSDAPELGIIDEMWQIADAAQMFYKKHGRYPRQPIKDWALLRHLNPRLSFNNSFSQKTMTPELTVIRWPAKETPSNPTAKISVEDKWLSGTPLGQGMTLPGLVRCAQLGWPELDPSFAEDANKYGTQQIDDFFIEGYNRFNELIKAADGKVFLITLRKGEDMTPMAVARLVPVDAKSPVSVVISANERPNKVSVALKYLLLFIVVFGGLAVWKYFATIEKWLRREK